MLLTHENELFKKPAVGVAYLDSLRVVFNRSEVIVSAKMERPGWVVAGDFSAKEVACGLVIKDHEYCNFGLEASRAKKGFHLWTNPILKEEGDYQVSTRANYTFLHEQGECKSWAKIIAEWENLLSTTGGKHACTVQLDDQGVLLTQWGTDITQNLKATVEWSVNTKEA